MPTRRSKAPKPSTIDVQGVLGTFKVPNANIAVEYVLTYASLDGGQTANGQLLDLLVPVREVFHFEELDFDHLLQRDLDDFRVANQMVPYLLGGTSSDPRFFPPIVAVIVPMATLNNMEERYPQCADLSDKEGETPLKVFKYGDVFSVKREVLEDGSLAQSLVDLSLHPTKAKLVIVDGQHRAMAMLATYRNTMGNWSGTGSEFRYFYEKETGFDISEFGNINLPVCIAYFPELTKSHRSSPREVTLTTACRKLFLDVNRNARHPSKARQILLDDTDLAALFTRHIFNMVQRNKKPATLRLYHMEYDNPHDRQAISRQFALTDVYTIFTIVRSILLLDDNRVRNPMAPVGGRLQNDERLRRELELVDAFTEEEIERLGIDITHIEQLDYPKQAEQTLRNCFEDAWGKVILTCLTKLYPFSKQIEAVDAVLRKHEPYIGTSMIAHTALIEGQGLRHALDNQQGLDREHREKIKMAGDTYPTTKAEEAWKALLAMEQSFQKERAKLYLKLKKDPTPAQIAQVNRLYDCFRSSAFQNGLFMALACLKDRLEIPNNQFIGQVEAWITRINKKFQNNEKIRTVLFDHSEPKSIRHIFKPRGGLIPNDWPFFRYIIFELLSK